MTKQTSQEGHNIFGGKLFMILTLLADWLQEKPSATSLLSTRVMECVTRDVLLWHVTWQSNLASNPVNCQWFIHPKIPSQGEGLGVIWWWFSFGESCCLSDHSKVARSKSMTMFVGDDAIVFVITRYCGEPQACKYFFIGSSVWSRLQIHHIT